MSTMNQDDSGEFEDDEQVGPIQVKQPTGSIATGPTINMLTRPPLSRKYLLNPRGTRDDVPEWSKRPEGFTLRSVNSIDE